eukprot:Sdes_comp16228_c0_seq1m5520
MFIPSLLSEWVNSQSSRVVSHHGMKKVPGALSLPFFFQNCYCHALIIHKPPNFHSLAGKIRCTGQTLIAKGHCWITTSSHKFCIQPDGGFSTSPTNNDAT